MSIKFKSGITLEALSNASTDTDRFLVSDSGNIKYRTGTQLLSDIGGQAALTNPITGTGTTNYVSKFTGTSALGNSIIFDTGTALGIGTTSPIARTSIVGTITGEVLSLKSLVPGAGNYILSCYDSDDSDLFSVFGNILSSNYSINIGDWQENMSLPYLQLNSSSAFFQNTNLGVGTASPSTKLEVNGVITATGGNSTQWNAKQVALVSGNNIKTVNGNSILGSGNLSTRGVHTLIVPPSGQDTSFNISATTLTTTSSFTNRIVVVPYIPANTFSCISLYINVAIAAGGANARILIYSDNNGVPGTKVYESGNLSCSTTGVKSVTTTQNFIAGTTYWIGTHSSAAFTYTAHAATALLPIISNPSSQVTQFYTTAAFGSAPSTFGSPLLSSSAAPFIGITI